MTPSRLLALSATLLGAAGSLAPLRRRHQWEQTHRRVTLCVDYDDAQDAAVRAGLPFPEMLARLADAGATHVSLPELTLARSLALGRLAPRALARAPEGAPPVGHWSTLQGEPGLVRHLADELAARVPHAAARVVDETGLAFAGNLRALGGLGLGFEASAAAAIRAAGLAVVPRPVAYDWPDPTLLARTLADAADHGTTIAFAGNMILGHEMHLDATVAALAEHDLRFVYFAESRHQKGDWFVAKRRAPHIVLGHQMTPAEMVPLDYHAAAHNWAHLARERGIRFCYLNFFRVLHATAPLEGLRYVHAVQHALDDAGYEVGAENGPPVPAPAPSTADLALSGLAAGGIAAAAATTVLPLPERVAGPLTALITGGAAALPLVERAWLTRRERELEREVGHGHHHGHDHDHDHDHPTTRLPDHEHDHAHDHDHDHTHPDLVALYPPSYSPKLIALAAAALGPGAALGAARADGAAGWLAGVVYQVAAALALAGATSGPEYQLRIEVYRGFDLDLLLPLAGAALTIQQPLGRAGALGSLALGWALARQGGGGDLLARLDPGHAEGHTHHISAAMRLVGDIGQALGPRPARKWFGLGALSGALSLTWADTRPTAASAAAYAAALGSMLGLVGFRRPERALADTAREAGPSLATGAALGLLALWRDA